MQPKSGAVAFVLTHTQFESPHRLFTYSDSDGPDCYRASVRLKQFIGKGYGGRFAITFPAVVRTGIWHLFMVPAIAHLLFAKDTMGVLNVHQRMLADRTPDYRPSEGRHTH